MNLFFSLRPFRTSCDFAKFCLRIELHSNWDVLCFPKSFDFWNHVHRSLREVDGHHYQQKYASTFHFKQMYKFPNYHCNSVLFWWAASELCKRHGSKHCNAVRSGSMNVYLIPWWFNTSSSSLIYRNSLFLIVSIPVGHLELHMYFKNLSPSFNSCIAALNFSDSESWWTVRKPFALHNCWTQYIV